MEARDLSFGQIQIGDAASFERVITASDIAAFSMLSGDTNPLHTDAAYAATTLFKKPIAHGMLLGSLCSTLVGMYLPGKRCLYLAQSLVFKKPVYAEEAVLVAGSVTEKSSATSMLTIAITITRDGEVVVEGEAKVQVLP